MTPAQFSKIGETLYGPSWRARMGQALVVAERTIRRWQDGDTPIPDGIQVELAELCRRHASDLMIAEGELLDLRLKALKAQLSAVAKSINADRIDADTVPRVVEATGIVDELIAHYAKPRLGLR